MAPRDQLIEPRQDVVARHQPDAHLAPEPELAGHIEHRFGAAAGVHPAGVAGDPNSLARDVGENALHERNEISGVSRVGVARLLLLHDGHRHFSEIIHHQIVDRDAADLPHRRLQPVAPEPLSRSDPHHAVGHGSTPPSPPGSTTSRRQRSSPTRATNRPSSAYRSGSGQGGDPSSNPTSARAPGATWTVVSPSVGRSANPLSA